MAVDTADEADLEERIAAGGLEFDDWIGLISDVEKRYPDNIDKISSVYEAFLSKYPLCYGYWRNYADHKARLCTLDEVVEVFERSVESAAYSVDIWVGYCSFGISCFEDGLDVSRLFGRALSFVGKDYLCHHLWDLYIEYEFSQQHWSSLAHIYIQTLKFPTKKLHQYYDSFKKLVATWRADLESEEVSSELYSELPFTDEVKEPNDDEICCIIDKLLNPSARVEGLAEYSSIGDQLYHRSNKLEADICEFEKKIHRPYFHVKPLDDHQLDNWHKYLDFGERQGDFDWAVKLYERCLIPCANYPEFWMRYVEFVEAKGGREIANDALDRATHVFLKWLPDIHLINAGFKEQIGEFDEARAAFHHLDRDLGLYSVESVLRKANMEKRMGKYLEASNIFKEALKVAADRKLETLPLLYVHFSHLEYAMTTNADATRDILLDGIHNVPNCKLLLEELIKFAMAHEGARMVNTVESVVADALSSTSDVSPGLSATDREYLSSLYLEFIDLHGTINESRTAWYRHMKSFPHLFRSAPSKQPTRPAPVQNIAAVRDPVDSATHLMQSTTQVETLSPTSQLGHPEEANSSLNLPEPASLVASKRTINPADTCDDDTAQLSPYVDIVGDDEFLTFDAAFKHQERKEGPDQEVQLLKLDTLSLNTVADNPTRSPTRESKALQGSSICNSRVPGYNSKVEDAPSLSSPLRIQANILSSRVSESPCPTPMNPSPVSTPDSSQFERPTDRGPNQTRHNYSGRHIGTGSPGRLEDQVDDKWLCSPRRQGSLEQSDGWRHKEWPASPAQPSFRRDGYRKQSVSPRRYRSRRHSEDRYHSPSSRSSPRRHPSATDFDSKSNSGRHYQRQPRYGDGSRGHRGGQRRNLRQMQNMGNQSTGFATQGNVQGQPGSFPQAQMFMHPMQGNGQYPFAQNPQAYAQMWQFYYFQQQQLMQQQLAMQQQKPYPQPQQFQMQPRQQQQFVQLQYQQQLQVQQQQQQEGSSQQPQQVLNQQPQQQIQPDQLQQQQLYQQAQLVPQQQSDQQMPTQQLQQQQLYQQQYYNQQQQQSQQYTLTQEQLQQLYEQLQRLPQQQQAGQQASTQQSQLLQQQAGQQASAQQQEQLQKQQQEQQQQYQQFQQQYALYLQQQQMLQKPIQQQQSLHQKEGLKQEHQSSPLKNVSRLTRKEQPKDDVLHEGHEDLVQHKPSELHQQWYVDEQSEAKEDGT